MLNFVFPVPVSKEKMMVRWLSPQELSAASSPTQAPNELKDFFPLSHVIWAAMEKVGSKQLKREMIPDGSRHLIDVTISGLIDGQPFSQSLSSVLTAGHALEKSSSANPQVPELVAYLLSKLNSQTRNRILNDVPREFAENDCQLPNQSPVLLDEANQMLKQLRQTKTLKSRAPIRCEYALH